MQLETKIALFGGLIPGAVSLAVLLPAWLRWRTRTRRTPDAPGNGPVWIAPVLAFVAFALADYAVNGPPSLWTPHAPARFVHAVGLLCLVGLAEGLARPPAWAVAVLRAAALGAGVWMLGRPYVPHAVPWADFIGWLGLAMLGGAAVLGCAEAGARSLQGPVGPLALLAVVGVSAAAVVGNTLAYAGMTAAAPSAVLVAAMIASMAVPGLTLARGGATAVVGICLLWIVGAIFQTEVRTVPGLVLLGLAPAGLAGAWWVRQHGWPARLAVAVVLTGACLGGSSLATWLAQPEGDGASSDDDYDMLEE